MRTTYHTKGNPMIEIRGLRHQVGDFVLEVPQLILPKERYVVILGPSGCGKTMLLRVITGLIQPAVGAIRIGDQDVTFVPPERRRIALVAQEPSLFPHQTVRENVAYGLMVRGIPRREYAERVDELISVMRLHALVKRPVRSLSGGESQKVALARALAIRPQVLVLDEPLSHVDRDCRDELVQELRRVHKDERLTTVHVTHDRDEARELADVYAIMRAGVVKRYIEVSALRSQTGTAFPFNSRCVGASRVARRSSS